MGEHKALRRGFIILKTDNDNGEFRNMFSGHCIVYVFSLFLPN